MNRNKTVSNMRLLIRRTVLIIMSVVFMVAYVQPVCAAETEKQTVRVAYFDMGDYYKEISDGVVDSYDTEKLNKIESYSNLTFEYVNCGTWSNALEMLTRHEVDIVGTAQWTSERENLYEFCLESYGYTVAELATLPDKGIVYEDYDAIGQSVIGCVDGYVRTNDMLKMFSEHGISPKIKYYSSQAELIESLESGEVDIIAANSHTLKESYEVVEKFKVAPYFFISWKGNEDLVEQLDDAIIRIGIEEPGTGDAMIAKYFPSIIGAPLTKEEHDLIAENKVYDIYFDSDAKPTSWYDEESGTMKGGLVEVCNQISKTTGLKFNYLPIVTGETQLNGTEIKATTVYEGVEQNILAIQGETQALLNENFNLYYYDTKDLMVHADDVTIAIVANRVHLRTYIEQNYPKATIVEYDTPKACIQAVNDHEVDFTYLNCRNADNAITEMGLSHVKQFPIEAQKHGIALLVPGENQELLVSIINKGTKSIDENAIYDFYVQTSLDTDTPVTLGSLAKDHLGWLLVIVAILACILAVFAILITYAQVMKKQKDKVEKADAERTEFFGRMSHDMRTPMNGILGMIELSESVNNLPEEVAQNLHNAKKAGIYMLSLINDTLDLQRMESKKLKLETNIVNVGDYYSEIFSTMKVSAELKNIDFKVEYIGIDLDSYIEIDSVRLRQVFSNLISNAIKYTQNSGAVVVVVEAIGDEGDIMHRKYQIRDTGVGMSEDFIKNRLYQPYAQETNELSSQLTGSGLGMAITKNLVEIMGGRLEVESELGEGTVFTLYLDLKRATKEQAEQAKKQKEAKTKTTMGELSGKRILLCEDHPLNAEIAKKLLAKAGCVVEWAENGQIGVDCFAKSEDHYFDAIIMDMRMPVMDGLTATREIRKLSRADAATIPIIAMTANAYDSDINNCLEAGMNAHIAKPVDPAILYATLENYLKS